MTNQFEATKRLLIAYQVLGAEHEHRDLLRNLQQLYRDHFLSFAAGHVVLVCMDDMARLPLDQALPDKKVVQSVDHPVLLPYEAYPAERYLVVSTFLILCKATRANLDRVEGRRKPLTRAPASTLPVDVRRQMALDGTAGQGSPVEVKVTDRSGFGVAVIKRYGKDKHGAQLPWSQPSNGVQHAEDIVQFIRGVIPTATQRHNPRQRPVTQHRGLVSSLSSHSDPRKCVPYLVITSDGGSDETIRNPMTLIALWSTLEALDLDGIEKHHYCPYNSKSNPDEMLNRSVKLHIRGSYISAGSGSEEDMKKASATLKKKLADATHAGEPILTLVAADSTMLEIEKAPIVKAYLEERKKHAPDWQRSDVPQPIRDQWSAEDEEGEKMDFELLERKFLRMRQHIRRINLYSVVIAKCPPGTPPCDYCRDQPRRGTYDATLRAHTNCDSSCTEGDLNCTHAVLRQIEEIQAQFDAITTPSLYPPRKCGICRQEGHDKRRCPQSGAGEK